MNPAGTGSLNATGTLTINGVPKSITMKVEGKRIEGKKYLFEGSQTLLMSDFGIDPPTMFFGTVSTGDAVTVHFSVVADPSAAEANAGM
jgi:polyisoprenoid-binding protein YceI